MPCSPCRIGPKWILALPRNRQNSKSELRDLSESTKLKNRNFEICRNRQNSKFEIRELSKSTKLKNQTFEICQNLQNSHIRNRYLSKSTKLKNPKIEICRNRQNSNIRNSRVVGIGKTQKSENWDLSFSAKLTNTKSEICQNRRNLKHNISRSIYLGDNKNKFDYSFMQSFIHLFIHSFIHSSNHLSICSFILIIPPEDPVTDNRANPQISNQGLFSGKRSVATHSGVAWAEILQLRPPLPFSRPTASTLASADRLPWAFSMARSCP